MVTVAYWAVAPLLSPRYFDRGMVETSTAIYADFVPVPKIESDGMHSARIVAAALDRVRICLVMTIHAP